MIYKIYVVEYQGSWQLKEVAYNYEELTKKLTHIDPNIYAMYMVVRRDVKQDMDEILVIEDISNWKSRKMNF